MNIEIEHVARLEGHKPLVIDSKTLLTARGNKLYLFKGEGNQRQIVATLKMTTTGRLVAPFFLLRRIFRFGIQCAHQINSKDYLLACREKIYRVNATTGEDTIEKNNRQGFRPLSFAEISNVPGFNDGIYYGEYGSNRKRCAIDIIGRKKTGEWRTLYTFPPGKIEHVHSLVPDPYRQCVWVLTGDYDQAAGIWMARDNFQEIDCIVRGRQVYRASVGYPVPEGLLYATDSHLEKNSIRLLYHNKERWVTIALRPMAGSCIYSGKLDDIYFFSTAYEPGLPTGNKIRDLLETKPGPGITSKYCEVVAGNPEKGFKRLIRWKADIWPKRLFQFSSIIFPSVHGEDGSLLAIYGAGCKGHNDCTELYRITKS